jgi:hypothetical protein
VLSVAACESSDGGGGDVPSPDAAGAAEGSAPAEASAPDAADGSRDAGSGFSLLVTETPPGPTIPQNLWGGVLRFTFAGDGAPLSGAPGIDRSKVSDPASLAFRAASSEVFVGNRHGNTGAPSISRFVYDPVTGTLTPNGTITGNSLNQVSQIAFHPITGELFAANLNIDSGGLVVAGPKISRFTFDGAGNAVPNGTLGTGSAGGVAVAPDGKRLYTTFDACIAGTVCSAGSQTSNVIQQLDLAGGAESTATTIASAARLFQFAWRESVLYVGALDDNQVFRLTIDASDNLTLKDSIAADAPGNVAFSPDGREMFTAGTVTSSLIGRFTYDATKDSWTPLEKITTSSSLGGIVIVPGGAGLAIDAGVVFLDAAPD